MDDDDYTARAAILQPAPASCWLAAHRRLAGVDDFYTARAAIRQPAPAGCRVAAHRRLAGVDGLYSTLSAIRQPAPADCISIPLVSPGNVCFFSAIDLARLVSSFRLLILGRTYGTYLHYVCTYTTIVPTL